MQRIIYKHHTTFCSVGQLPETCGNHQRGSRVKTLGQFTRVRWRQGVLVFYLQDAWKQVSKVLQQGCVAFICQNKGRCSSSRQGTDLRDHFKKIKYEWNKLSWSQDMNCPKSTLIGPYLWVSLVLHALNKHTLDNLHIVLLLVPEDSWEVPKEVKTHTSVSHQCFYLNIVVWSLTQHWYGLNERFGMEWTGAHQNMCRAASRRPTLSEFTDSNRNLSNSGHWLFPSSSR